jgi:hypothetical protein
MKDNMSERAQAVHEAVHERRRRFLVQALSSGLLAGGLGWDLPALAGLFGRLPGKMPEGRSVFEVQGEVRVNGEPATRDTLVGAESHIETGAGSYLIVAVGDGAFIVRERSVVEMTGRKLLVRGLQLVSGALLSVFGRRDESQAISASTPVATIGIRGTGFYIEAESERTYFCTCYGHTVVTAKEGGESEDAVSHHHDAPRYILAQAEGGRHIVPAPFKNHTDLELMTLEALCGREVPFVIPRDTYEAPRRDY